MKKKVNAREKRDAEVRRRQEALSPKKPSAPPEEAPVPDPVPFRTERFPDRSPEEDTLEFLAYLEKHGTRQAKEDLPRSAGKKNRPSGSPALPRINLEEGMPVVEEALGRMNMALQEMRVSRLRAVKLIHGYGSTGRGGRIRDGVREELSRMKKKGLIKDWIPGEDFGPLDPASRKLAEQDKNVPRDPDYGRSNHGITVVIM